MNEIDMEDILMAAWESRGGKYRVELYRRPKGWWYRGYTNGMGRGYGCWPALGMGRDAQARYGLIAFGRRLRMGHFQADANKELMRRTS